jgi:hypothetical protein
MQDRWDILYISQIVTMITHFSVEGLVWLECCPIEGYAYSPLVDNACIPSDIALSAIKFFKTSSMDFSSLVCSIDILIVNK